MLVSCLCDQNDQLSFLGVEVHVTRASSLPKIKARFHIFMLGGFVVMRPKRPTLVLGVEVHALQLYTRRYLCNDMVLCEVEVHVTRARSLPKMGNACFVFMRPVGNVVDAINTRLWVTR